MRRRGRRLSHAAVLRRKRYRAARTPSTRQHTHIPLLAIRDASRGRASPASRQARARSRAGCGPSDRSAACRAGTTPRSGCRARGRRVNARYRQQTLETSRCGVAEQIKPIARNKLADFPGRDRRDEKRPSRFEAALMASCGRARESVRFARSRSPRCVSSSSGGIVRSLHFRSIFLVQQIGPLWKGRLGQIDAGRRRYVMSFNAPKAG